MARLIFFIVLFLNIVLGAYLFLKDDQKMSQEANNQRFNEQMQPDTIKILASNDVQSSGKASIKTNSVTDGITTCLEVNLANEREVIFAQKELRNREFNLGSKVINLQMQGKYLLYKNITKAEAELQSLRQKAIQPITILPKDGGFVLALGVFKDLLAAQSYQSQLQSRGVTKLEILDKQDLQMNVFWLRVPEASIQQDALFHKMARKLGLVSRYCQDV